MLFVAALYDKLVVMSKKYKMPFHFWAGPYLIVQVADPDDLQVVMTQALEKPFFYKYTKEWLGETGLITSSVEVWQQHRQVLAPSFNWKVLENYMVTLDEKASWVLVEELRPHSTTKRCVDVFDMVCKCTLDIIMGKTDSLLQVSLPILLLQKQFLM
jgi:cytochrome P450